MNPVPRSPSSVRGLLAAGAAALVLAGGGAVAYGVISDHPAPTTGRPFGAVPSGRSSSAAPVTSPSPTASAPHHSIRPRAGTQSSRAHRAGPTGSAVVSALPPSRPVRLSIPAIGLSSTSFEKLGLTSDGALAAPRDPARVGWFAAGASPGSPGVAVIAGHVTWNGTPAAFYRLGRLHPGDIVSVARKDGSTARFRVRAMRTVAKDRFPTQQVYRYSAGPQLVLITCGGHYDRQQHYYDSNVIVWADFLPGIGH